MDSVKELTVKVDQEFRGIFGRSYGMIEPILLEDAEVVLVTAGSITSTARLALRELREQGHKIGLLKMRLFRLSRERRFKRLFGERKRLPSSTETSLLETEVFLSGVESSTDSFPGPPVNL